MLLQLKTAPLQDMSSYDIVMISLICIGYLIFYLLVIYLNGKDDDGFLPTSFAIFALICGILFVICYYLFNNGYNTCGPFMLILCFFVAPMGLLALGVSLLLIISTIFMVIGDLFGIEYDF